MRDGRVLHALQPAARAPDPHPPHRLQPLLQAQELQDVGRLRTEAPGAGAEARGGATDKEDPAGKDYSFFTGR